MTYTKNSNEWFLIRAKTGNWFDKSSMKWFGTKVYWNSLVKHGADWYFITSEDNFPQTEKFFVIRKVNENFDIDTIGGYKETKTLQEIKQKLVKIIKLEVKA